MEHNDSQLININVWDEEQQLKDAVYRFFSIIARKQLQRRESVQKYVASGAYEDQDAFTAYNDLGKHYQNEKEISRLIKILQDSPYFAHVSLSSNYTGEFQMMLSDSSELDEIVDCNELIGKRIIIVPFKLDANRPMFSKLFNQYQQRKTGSFSLPAKSGAATNYYVSLIRDVTISNKELINVLQLAPELNEEESASSFDDLLASRLNENRSSAKLNNIIRTLQLKQFDVIRADAHVSFVVQGCPGSGKTQCLIHRLFYLRAVLSNHGWDRVLLITPTQLFRNYSYELMRRYHLLDIKNCSLASFYYELLGKYDNRFRARQYRIELTEEFLPDLYLQEVYAPPFIATIEQEINHAIRSHIESCHQLLGLSPSNTPYSKKAADRLVRLLEKRIEEFDKAERGLNANSQYSEAMHDLEEKEAALAQMQKRLSSLESKRFELDSEKAQHEYLSLEYKKALDELDSWDTAIAAESQKRKEAYLIWQKRADQSSSPSLLSKLKRAQDAYNDYTAPSSETYRQNAETRQLYQDCLDLAEEAYESFMQGKNEKKWNESYVSRYRHNTLQIAETRKAIRNLTSEIEELTATILEMLPQDESLDKRKKTYRDNLEKSRNYLSRLESNVFEQEVWKILTAIRKKHGVKEFDIEDTADGHKRQIRILYKSDLLFYLKIYALLYSKDKLPKLEFICIDEGQDLHRADYQMLKVLYPNACFNIFGDTSQVLHESCGVSNWKSDCGIDSVFYLNCNYRNRPEIVEFCKNRFGAKMESVPIPISPQHIPHRIANDLELKQVIQAVNPLTIIVKSSSDYDCLLEKLPFLHETAQLLTTTAEKETPNKIHCYTVFAAKGLEFSNVLVMSGNMTQNQQLVACTRALDKLYYM